MTHAPRHQEGPPSTLSWGQHAGPSGPPCPVGLGVQGVAGRGRAGLVPPAACPSPTQTGTVFRKATHPFSLCAQGQRTMGTWALWPPAWAALVGLPGLVQAVLGVRVGLGLTGEVWEPWPTLVK